MAEQSQINSLFKITIPGLRELAFKSCEGIESQMEVLYLEQGIGLKPPATARGTQRQSKITFSKGTTAQEKGATIFDWYQAVCDLSKPLDKKILLVTLISGEGKKIAEWKIVNAWPCGWSASLLSKEWNELSLEYLTFVHEGIERKG